VIRHGYSPRVISENIRLEIHRGKVPSQAIAIAYENARASWRAVHGQRPFPPHLRLK
jgi:hypothetical protein